MKPLITIAIPTYKRPKYLKQAIDSAVNQKNVNINYDIIVVNNDPETDMSYIENQYKSSAVSVSFFTNDHNLGMLGNVNRCVELARGKYISFLHDDDLLLDDYICSIGSVLKNNNIPCLIPKRYLLFEGKSGKKNGLEKKRRKKSFLKHCFISRLFKQNKLIPLHVEDNVYCWQNCYCAPSCGVLFDKDVIKKYNLFFPEGTLSWDFISFLHLNKNETIYIYDKVLSVYRMTVGLSLKDTTQYDFYKSFDDLLNDCKKNKICIDFVSKYENEIRYLNYVSLSSSGADYVKSKEKNVVDNLSDKHKYTIFMFNRIKYWSEKRLDVEIPLNQKGINRLKIMKVITE